MPSSELGATQATLNGERSQVEESVNTIYAVDCKKCDVVFFQNHKLQFILRVIISKAVKTDNKRFTRTYSARGCADKSLA